jgi:hypothetical protein
MSMLAGLSVREQMITIHALSWRLAIVLVSVPVFLTAATGTATQTLSATISAYGELSVPSTASVTNSGTTFVAYTGSTTVSYKIRTTALTGSGSLTVQATTDFSPTGGPSIAGGALTYTCGTATLGTPCSGTQTLSTTSQTQVLTAGAGVCTGGGGSCSATNPNTVQTSFILANNPAFSTGTYSATLTFTISAL